MAKRDLRKLSDEELAELKQALDLDRAEAEAAALAAIEPVKAELDRRAFLAGFTPEELEAIAEAARG
jgi:hypothetical protein